MQRVPGDIRLERDAAGGIILRCDGAALGAPVDPDNAAEAALALARWFCAAGGVTEGRGRMAALIARGIHPDDGLRGTVAPAPAATPPEPGPVAQGLLVGIALGQMQAATLAALAQVGALRVTPWRMLLIEGAQRCPDLPGLILHKDDPLRRVVACTGAPGCHQALRPVRDLARRLAPQVPQGRLLHVSGCAKGCAHPGAADVTLVATARGFDLIRGGTVQDPVARCDLTTDEIEIGSHF
jgi:precorrin-3B synthase